MKSRYVKLSEDTYNLLKQLAEPFEDTPETVIRRLVEAAIAFKKETDNNCAASHVHQALKDRDFVEIRIGGPMNYEQKYNLIPLNKATIREFFPGYKIPFVLETEIGEIVTKVTSASQGTPIGHPTSGKCIMGNLRPWYEYQTPKLKNGGVLRITCVEPMKRYTLGVVE